MNKRTTTETSTKRLSETPIEYQYAVNWSDEDAAYIARVAEFPSLAAHGPTQEDALRELQQVVVAVMAELAT